MASALLSSAALNGGRWCQMSPLVVLFLIYFVSYVFATVSRSGQGGRVDKMDTSQGFYTKPLCPPLSISA